MATSIATADAASDLQGILDLQKRNLRGNLSGEERLSQGFLTVAHSFTELKELNDIEKHIVVRNGDTVIGYILAMTARSSGKIPILIPMFSMFDQHLYKGKPIVEYKYMVVGQVCMAREFRGQGLLALAYSEYRKHHEKNYDFAITEIAAANERSLRAHTKIGFKEIHRYLAPNGVEWVVVVWEWRTN